jgi:hypothetical protein
MFSYICRNVVEKEYNCVGLYDNKNANIFTPSLIQTAHIIGGTNLDTSASFISDQSHYMDINTQDNNIPDDGGHDDHMYSTDVFEEKKEDEHGNQDEDNIVFNRIFSSSNADNYFVEKNKYVLSETQKYILFQFYVYLRLSKKRDDVHETTRKINFFIYITNDIFTENDIQIELVNMYIKCQRIYHSLLKFRQVCKIKCKKVHQADDLYMNQINPHSKSTFYLVQEGKLYLFTLFDLKKIIIGALTSSSNFFSIPAVIKNPYNNIPLTKPDLFNVYLKMVDSGMSIHFFIERFFKMEFDVYEFKKKYENDILEYNVVNHVQHSSAEKLFGECVRLIRLYDNADTFIIPISNNEVETLVNMLRPILKVHYLKKYTGDRYKRGYYEKELSRKMEKFMFSYVTLGNSFYKTDVDEFRLMMCDNGIKWNNSHVYNDSEFNYYALRGTNENLYSSFRYGRERMLNNVFAGSSSGAWNNNQNAQYSRFTTPRNGVTRAEPNNNNDDNGLNNAQQYSNTSGRSPFSSIINSLIHDVSTHGNNSSQTQSLLGTPPEHWFSSNGNSVGGNSGTNGTNGFRQVYEPFVRRQRQRQNASDASNNVVDTSNNYTNENTTTNENNGNNVTNRRFRILTNMLSRTQNIQRYDFPNYSIHISTTQIPLNDSVLDRYSNATNATNATNTMNLITDIQDFLQSSQSNDDSNNNVENNDTNTRNHTNSANNTTNHTNNETNNEINDALNLLREYGNSVRNDLEEGEIYEIRINSSQPYSHLFSSDQYTQLYQLNHINNEDDDEDNNADADEEEDEDEDADEEEEEDEESTFIDDNNTYDEDDDDYDW